MDHQFNVSKSSKAVINFALLFLWISLPLMAYVILVTVFALIAGQATLDHAIINLFGLLFGLFLAITIPLVIVNQYNRIRVAEEGLYVEVYAFRHIWRLIDWDDILGIRLSPRLDRWGKPQWLIRVKELTFWHRWISWLNNCGSEPSILINSDLIDGVKLLKVIEKKTRLARV